MALGRSAVVVSALAVGALLTTGGTYAAFSDYAEVTGNQVAAGTVVIGGDGGAAPDLTYAGLAPGTPVSDSMRLRYTGTIAADLWLELEPSEAETFCSANGGGWSAKPGGSLQIKVGAGDWTDYCGALSGSPLRIADDVQPSTTLDVEVQVQLSGDADSRYSGLTGADGLVVKALQTGAQGFSDFASGTITIGVGTIAPVIPAECLAAGFTSEDFDASNTVYLTESGVFNAPKQPENGHGYLIIGTDGDDIITGSNQADCIIGGGGNDHLIGGNQSDVLLGGDGDDVLNGAGDDATDDKSGGNGKDRLYGQGGDDQLHGANGKDLLDGGDQDDTCVDTPNGNGNGQSQGNGQGADEGASQGNPGGNGDDTFLNCESDGTAPAQAGPDADADAVAGSDAPEATDTADELGFVDPEPREQPDGASTGTGGEPTTEPTTTPTPTPAPAATVVPTADADVAGGDGSTPSPSPSPLSTVVIATEGS